MRNAQVLTVFSASVVLLLAGISKVYSLLFYSSALTFSDYVMWTVANAEVGLGAWVLVQLPFRAVDASGAQVFLVYSALFGAAAGIWVAEEPGCGCWGVFEFPAALTMGFDAAIVLIILLCFPLQRSFALARVLVGLTLAIAGFSIAPLVHDENPSALAAKVTLPKSARAGDIIRVKIEVMTRVRSPVRIDVVAGGCNCIFSSAKLPLTVEPNQLETLIIDVTTDPGVSQFSKPVRLYHKIVSEKLSRRLVVPLVIPLEL